MRDAAAGAVPPASFSLAGRVALVTGAARGLGLEIARALAASGAHAVLNGRDPATLAEAAARLAAEGLRVSTAPFDVVDGEAVRDGVGRIADRHGRLDILVHAAGQRHRKPLLDFSDADIAALVAVDLTAAILVAREAARVMVPAGYGRLIQVTSIAGSVARANDAVYSAAKHGVTGLVRALAAEYGTAGITSNAIAPGGFATEANAAMLADDTIRQHFIGRTSLKRWGEPREIGGAAVFLASEAASYVTGHVLVVDGGHSVAM